MASIRQAHIELLMTYTINYDAKKYDGQQGTVMQEVQTSWSTYVQIKLGSGATIWLDKAGVRAS